jgi:hypothetical protein
MAKGERSEHLFLCPHGAQKWVKVLTAFAIASVQLDAYNRHAGVMHEKGHGEECPALSFVEAARHSEEARRVK